nr:hypothetical protein [Tanacetum cinerariifolium]
MNYPIFTKVIFDYFMTRKPSIWRRNRINWHYVRDDALFSTIKVVSRHQTTQQYGAILPIELTTAEIRNRKQPLRATTPVEPTDVQRTEAEQLKIVLKRSRQETHISQQSGFDTDEGTDDDDDDDEDNDDNDEEEELAKSDEEEESGKGGDEVRESEGESDEEQEEEESFDPIPRTPDESDEESNDEGEQDLRLSEEARIQEEEDADELYRDVNIN